MQIEGRWKALSARHSQSFYYKLVRQPNQAPLTPQKVRFIKLIGGVLHLAVLDRGLAHPAPVPNQAFCQHHLLGYPPSGHG